MNDPRGSIWRKWDLQVQTILDENYRQLKDYYEDLKSRDISKWNEFIDKVGGEENALKYDSKEYFTNGQIEKKKRAADYARTLFSFLDVYCPDLSCIALTDHNYYDDILIDQLIENGCSHSCQALPGVEINASGVHLIVIFGRLLFGKAIYSETIKEFLSIINVHTPKENGKYSVSSKSIEDVLKIVKDHELIPIFPHCNSDNGLFQERGKTDRTHLANMYNSNPVVILQAQQKNKIDDTINFIKNKPELTSKPIPTIASDSRALANIGNSDSDGNWCWIKADPTFMGLMQLLNEPVDRVFIGMRPKALEMLLVQPTKIIDAVVINKVEGSTLSEEWFGQEIVFNPELVAIIGNKGSGKSALADILGLLGNTPRYESFNFLHKDKFRKYPENKAGYFEASISWKDGNSDGPLVLDQNPKSFEMEKIKYIPQNYLEEICNEISTGEESKFYEEIQEVIFSHVPVPDRIKYSSLKELLNYRSEETRASIEYLMRDLQELNEQIIIYEEHLSDNYKKGLESKQAEKKKELDAYNNPSVKPKEEKPPQENPEILEKTKIISSELEKKQEEYKTILANIKALEAEDSLIAQRYAITDKILIRFQNVDRQLKKVIEETKSELISIGINQKEIFDYQFNAEPLEKKKIELQSRRNEISRKLDQKELGSLAYSLANLSSKIIELQSQLTEPQKKYQLYQKQYRAWDEKRLIIELSKREIDNQLVELNSIPKKLDDLIKERGRKTLEIFQEKRKLKDYYVSYYSGVHKFLNEDSIAKEKDFKLTFNVSIRENGFRDGFIKLINQRATGPFMGIQEGDGAIKKLVETANFDSEGDVTIFTNKILSEMKEYDGKKLNIEDQLAGKRTLRDLYDYIYSIQYLEPIYILKWDKKDLSQLSPGEKGNLLLIFYLLVDRDNIPLVIDQPEANLDNNTVFKTLVPCIKDAKKRRQIIIVTHNPNLAVVCDAEQIIHAQIEKEYKNKVTYTSGSIENLVINQCIVDVLEGTQPAFDNRDAKYIRERIHL